MILWGASDPGMSTKFRDKMISFRISRIDYAKLRECCVTQGVRSISKLARTAVGKIIRGPGRRTEERIEEGVNELEGQLRALALELRKLKGVE